MYRFIKTGSDYNTCINSCVFMHIYYTTVRTYNACKVIYSSQHDCLLFFLNVQFCINCHPIEIIVLTYHGVLHGQYMETMVNEENPHFICIEIVVSKRYITNNAIKVTDKS